MAKTISQTLSSVVKNEEHKNTSKLQRLLHRTNNVSKSKNKTAKNKTRNKIHITEVKSENEDDNKALLAKPTTASRIGSKITAEQITELIGYIADNKMSVKAAARKAGLNYSTARRYYNEYHDNPEHKMPLPKTGSNRRSSIATQLKIGNLIQYIVNDGMNVTQASKKVNISRKTAAKYYAKYLEDSERKIPLLAEHTSNSSRRYTQEEIADFIGYIVRDKMSLVEASKKANMSYSTVKRYYLKYLHDPNNEIPDPREFKVRHGRYCTNYQVKSVIEYIVNDGMTLLEASVKSKMAFTTAFKYYKQYSDDPENKIPTPEISIHRGHDKLVTLDQVKKLFSHILIDKLGINQAARKANISASSGHAYYNQYLKNPTQEIKMNDMSYSAEKMKRLVKLVQKEKRSLKEAANTVHLNYTSALKHYKEYLRNPRYKFPENKRRQYTQDDVKRLIHYIEQDRFSVASAARRINMDRASAYNYYTLYKNDPEHKIPIPIVSGYRVQQRATNKYTQIIADIYKNNLSIKPPDVNCDPKSDM